MGLQYRFSSFQWVATIPPILIVAIYKFYINRTYLPAFNYYNPTEEELRLAKVHSERADASGNRLEKRFGHPALHAELFTPMVFKEMVPLLSQVYSGKLNTEKTRMNEYGGQQMEAKVLPGGIRIAAIDQVCCPLPIELLLNISFRETWNMTSLYISAIVVNLIGMPAQ